MPTYEYACNACGEHLEAVQSFSDDPLTTCPQCGGDLRKVFGAVGIVLKGSGFYKNDSRSSSKAGRKAGAGDSSSSSSGSDTKQSGSGDSSSSSSSGDGAKSSSNGSSSERAPSKAASTS